MSDVVQVNTPHVILIHTWWGLNPDILAYADRLRTHGYVVHTPDLFDGRTADTEAAAEALLSSGAGASAAQTLTRLVDEIGLDTSGVSWAVLGLSWGGYWAMWLSAQYRSPRACVVYYGLDESDFQESSADYLLHFAETDRFVRPEAVAQLPFRMPVGEHRTRIETYAGTKHCFAESNRPEFDPAASELAWQRTIEFLDSRLKKDGQPQIL